MENEDENPLKSKSSNLSQEEYSFNDLVGLGKNTIKDKVFMLNIEGAASTDVYVQVKLIEYEVEGQAKINKMIQLIDISSSILYSQ